jgi:hypothetical protein
LQEVGVVEMNLGAKVGTQVDHGNLLGLVSSYTNKDGSTHEMADVWFSRDHAAAAASPSRSEAALTVTHADVLVDPGQSINLSGVGSGHAVVHEVAPAAATDAAPVSTMSAPVVVASDMPPLLIDDHHKNLLI